MASGGCSASRGDLSQVSEQEMFFSAVNTFQEDKEF